MYYSYNDFLRDKFGGKVYKLALGIATTCPNRDGTKGVGGCIFCAEDGSGSYATSDVDNAIARLKEKACGSYIAYFQSYSNTYCSVKYLKEQLEKILCRKDIVGIAIATRADCISEEMYRYLADLNKCTWLTVELGLQTIRDDIAKKHNRCHTYNEFIAAYKKLKEIGVRVTVHIINGLVGETEQDMINTANALAELKVDGIKIHCIHVLRGTKLADMYMAGEVKLPTLNEYAEIVAKQIALLPKSTVIERLTGDGDRVNLIAPLWSLKKRAVLNTIDATIKNLGIKQGDGFHEKFDGNSQK